MTGREFTTRRAQDFDEGAAYMLRSVARELEESAPVFVRRKTMVGLLRDIAQRVEERPK